MKALAITIGDPAGIGPEIVFRSLGSTEHERPVRIFGDWNLTRQALEACGIEADIPIIRDGDESDVPAAFVDVTTGGEERLEIGRVSEVSGRASLAAIEAAVSAIERGEATALVTAPIHKGAIRLAGSGVPGHTELLAGRAGLNRYAHEFAMFFDSPTLRVALLTVHIPLAAVPQAVRSEDIAALARLVDRELTKLDGARPRIRVAGLNPHAGEGGMFGREEEEIERAVEVASAEGIAIAGPFPADTIFQPRSDGPDVVMAMYHDQGLIPVKTLHFDEAVNVTLGLPYIRASVDHGTAFDIAGKGIANTAAMQYAMQWTLEKIGRASHR